MIVLGTAVAALSAFLLSGLYYALAPSPGGAAQGPDRSAVSTVVVELVRSAVVAALVAGLLTAAELDAAVEGALLGLALWLLPVVLLVGAVFHQGTSPASAALHAGDWLLKLIVVGVVLGTFH